MRIKRAFLHEYPHPKYHSSGAAGIDLYYVPSPEDTSVLYLYPGESRWIHTGWIFEIPPGFVGLVRDRSGWALSLTTRAGVIDSDYRGELKVCLRNECPFGEPAIKLEPGERIAQLLVLPCLRLDLVEGELTYTARGENGFGSTGGAA